MTGKTLALLGIICLWALGLQIWCGSQKAGYHGDEGYTYLLSSLGLADFRRLDGPPRPLTFSGQWARQVVDLQPARYGDYRTISVMTGDDIHPPLYYLLMHEVMHATGSKQNLWQGLGLNIACNLLTLPLLFLIARRLFPDQPLPPLLAPLLWSSSLVCLDLTLFSRMYNVTILFCCFSLWLCLEQLTRDKISLKLTVGWTLTVLAGSLTHYYFLVWICLLLPLAVFLLGRRRIKLSVIWVGSTLLALVMAAQIFPPALKHLTRSHYSQGASSKFQQMLAGDLAPVLHSLSKQAEALSSQFLYPEIVLLSLLALLALWSTSSQRWQAFRRPAATQLVGLILLSFAFALAIAITAPFDAPRYLAPILPLWAVFLSGIPGRLSPGHQKLFVSLLAASLLWHLHTGPLFHLYAGRTRPFHNDQQVGLVYVESHHYYKIWNLFQDVLPGQRYLFLVESHLQPDANGRVPAAAYLSESLLRRLQTEKPDCLLMDLPDSPPLPQVATGQPTALP